MYYNYPLFLSTISFLLMTVNSYKYLQIWPMMQDFQDTEMNKKLLKKNNGSIERVVMDLITGERQFRKRSRS